MTKTKAKIIAMCVTLALTVSSFFYSTLAYFTDSVSSSNGTLATGEASVDIIDVTYPYGSDTAVPPGTAIRIMPGHEISKTLTAKNSGSLPLYVRVQVRSDITLASNAQGRESEIDLSLVSYNINLTDWVEHNGYYYYRTALTGDTEAVPLFTKVIFSTEMGNLYKDSTIRVHTRIEVVQAGSNADNPIDAYGWSELPLKGGAAG